MTRREGLLALAAGFLLIAGGLVWLLGPWGLLVSGFALVVVTLFAFDTVTEATPGEAVEDVAPQPKQRGLPVQPRPVRR